MRNLIFIIILSLQLNLSGQTDNEQDFLEKFEGMWASDETDFFTVFTYSKVYGLKVFSFSFRSDAQADEKIVKIDGDKIIINITNPSTGYTTSGFYRILDDNTLILNYTGGNTDVKKSIYYKINFANEEGKAIDY